MYSWNSFLTLYIMVPFYFLIRVIPAVLLFCGRRKRRSYAKIHFFLLPVYVLMYSAVVTLVGMTNFVKSSGVYVLFILLLLGVFLLERLLFQVSNATLLFDLLGGYALNQLCQFLFYLVNHTVYSALSLSELVVQYMIEAVWYTFAYSAFYFVIIRRKEPLVDNITGKNPELYLSLGMFLFFSWFEITRTGNVTPYSTVDYMCILCQVFFYILILMLHSGLLKIIHVEREIALAQKVWQEKEKSLRLTAEAINTINIKYHDLKHIIPRIQNTEEIRPLIMQISQSMNDYACVFSTGNDTLDMILTEQMLKYKQNGIEFACIADGKALSFMDPLDIISLFANALDNAYEAVLPLDEKQREIYLSIKTAAGSVSICVENPYHSQIIMQDGLPQTIKADKHYHGFGMKSIRSTVEKHHGDLTVSAKDGWFKLSVLIPLR